MIRLDVCARQPLHLGVRPDAGWLTDTFRFVPGSVLRGALASVWLAAHRGPRPDVSADAEFLALFEGERRFGPLYPTDDALRPLSVFGCKYAEAAGCRAVAHDAAFDGPVPARCPVCDSPMEASKGRISDAKVVDHTRVKLDERGRAADGQLFTRRALAAGTRLTGLVSGSLDDGMAWLAEPDLTIRLGGRRSTSGLATVSARPEAEPPEFTGYQRERRCLVIRLTAPGVFVDEFGRPAWLPDPAELEAALGVPSVLEAAFARPTVVTGWHAAANLPKPRDFAVAAGSVYVLRFDHGEPDHAGLHRLWTAGLGLRRVEGNGWLSLQRWRPPQPSSTPAAAPATDPVHDLLRDLVGFGIADTILDDLRIWAQENHTDNPAADRLRDQMLARPRYSGLGDAAQQVITRALALDAADAALLARRIDDHLRSTRSGGRR